jgi:hypothetical protein
MHSLTAPDSRTDESSSVERSDTIRASARSAKFLSPGRRRTCGRRRAGIRPRRPWPTLGDVWRPFFTFVIHACRSRSCNASA